MRKKTSPLLLATLLIAGIATGAYDSKIPKSLQINKITRRTTINKNEKRENNIILPNGNILVNGTEIITQLKSNSAIAQKAKEITSNCSTNYQKAQALYVWIAKNIQYDTTEEVNILNGDNKIKCSAINAFNSKKGICEDFSDLYAVMGRDVGLSTRVVIGYGYCNNKWTSHAWNQVYIKSKGWINVDTTFANAYTTLISKNNLPFNKDGILSDKPYYTYENSEYTYKIYTEDYFNSTKFNTTHKNSEIIAQLGIA